MMRPEAAWYIDTRPATKLSFSACGFVNWCEAGVVATVQVDLWK
jgi:hypothetical protein